MIVKLEKVSPIDHPISVTNQFSLEFKRDDSSSLWEVERKIASLKQLILKYGNDILFKQQDRYCTSGFFFSTTEIIR